MLDRASVDVLCEISAFLTVDASLSAVCRAFRAALHRRRSVAVTVTSGRVWVGQQFAWMRRHAAGVQRLRLRCSVHASHHHHRGLLRALGMYAGLRTLDLAVGDAVLPLPAIVATLEGRLPELESLRLDLSFRSDAAPLNERFWRSLLRLRRVELTAEKPDDITDTDVAALGRCDLEGAARWREFRASVCQSGLTAAGVAALTAGLRRCPHLIAVCLDHSYGPRDDVAAGVAAGPLGVLPGLQRLKLVADGDGGGRDGPGPGVRFPADLGRRSGVRELALSVANQRVDARAAAFPPRLTRLHMDLGGCVFGGGDWVERVAAAVAATAPTLVDLALYVNDCALYAGEVHRLFGGGVRPLQRLRRLAVDLSYNRHLTDAAVAAAVAAVPADSVEALTLALNGLPGVAAVDLGSLSRCTTVVVKAGFAAHGIRVVLPPAAEAVALHLSGSTLAEPIVVPSTVVSLNLDLDGVRMWPPPPDRRRPERNTRCRRLVVSTRAASAQTVHWVCGLVDPAALTACRWSGWFAGDFLAGVAPTDSLSLNIYREDLAYPDSFAGIRALLFRKKIHRLALRLEGAADGSALAEMIGAATEAAGAATARLTVTIAGAVADPAAAAAVAAALRRCAVARAALRSTATTGLTETVLLFDATVAAGLGGGDRLRRRLAALPGVTIYTGNCLARFTATHLFAPAADW